MMKHIADVIREFDGIHDYKISEVKKTSYECFFVHRRPETVRGTSTTDITVTVYVDHEDKRGDSVFSVYASTTDEELREKLTLAVEKARLVNNQAYTLPADETLSEEIFSNMSEYEPKELACEVAKACFEANEEENGSLNALEIFLDKISTHIVNSRGIDKREEKYTAMIEAIPTWTEGGESVELYECHNFSHFDFDAVKAELRGKMEEVRDRYHAEKPAVMPDCTVILNAPELGSLMDEITGELNYGRVYAHANAYEKGAALQGDDSADKLTVTLSGKVEGGTANALFDADGVTLVDTTVIADGRVVSYYGGNRFAQYLGEKVTGNLPCTELAAGSMSVAEMEAQPYFECVSMSGLQVDIYNDYIGGEVRLAYYFDGKTKRALTGISISGKLSEALGSVRLSRELTTYNSYRGPKKAAFGGIAVV